MAAYNWVERFPATQPPLTANSQMGYHYASGKTVLLDNAGTTWLWDGEDWEEPGGVLVPNVGGGAGIAYDPHRHVLVLWGGAIVGGGGFNTDTYEWDGTDWTIVATADAPPERTLFFMDWCAATNTIIAFGGRDGASLAMADTWSYNGTDWVELFPAASPPARQGIAAGPNPDGSGSMVIFGGTDFAGPTSYTDTWKFDGATWTEIITGSNPDTTPNANYAWGMARDSSGKLVWYGDGNSAAGNNTRDTWRFDGTDWTLEAPVDKPSIGYSNSEKQISYDARRGETVLFPDRGATRQTWVWRRPFETTPTFHRIGGIQITLTDDGVEAPVTLTTTDSWQAS